MKNPPQPNYNPSTNQQESKQYFQETPQQDKERCDWNFTLSTVISSKTTVSDAIGVLEFDPSETFLSTGGIARKIRIYNVHNLNLSPDSVTFLDHSTSCDYYISTPAKLSSLKWKPNSSSCIIGSGDYDGVITEYDLQTRVPIFERDEHGGRRVWSMDYSHWNTIMGASGSDDGTMKMWDTRCDNGTCLASVQPNKILPSPVCCVEFNPFGEPYVSAGCADKRIYSYDMRKMDEPVFVMNSHAKAVTYTKYLDTETIISSSVDGCLMMWRTVDQRVVRTYKGHVNSRRFVGLSVWRNGGLFSCGSEDNRVFVYDMRWGDPVWVHGFDRVGEAGMGFVSGVCWRQMGEDCCTLVAGGSDGVLQFFQGQRKVIKGVKD